MLQEYENRIESISKPLFDIDIIESDYWVGVTDFSDSNQSLILTGNQINLPEKMRFPIVRFIDEFTFLAVDSRTTPNYKNGWIINISGEATSNFFAGDAIQDIVVTKDFIVVSYFDESYGSSNIESERIAVFDLEGNYLYGYMAAMGSDAVDVFDCYAATLVKDNKIIFYPYTQFPLVLFDVESKTQEVWQPPSEVAGSGAISKSGNTIYFHSPYHYKFGIYKWKIGSEEVERIATYSSHLRGLSNGKFLALGNSGYTIISFNFS